MNGSQILDDDMTLEEKLAAIDLAMKNAQEMADEESRSTGSISAPIDPAMLTICEGCE